MEFKIDLHSHTNTSPHAYSTLEENIKAGKKIGLKILANTMHGPALQDSPHWWAIGNQRALPKFIDGIRVLKGIETNILNEDGDLDLNDSINGIVDIVIGGFHSVPEYGETGNKEKNTKAILNVIKNGKVDIIVHLGNPSFPVDYKKVIIEAKKYNVAIEINNGSLTSSRKGSKVNCEEIIELCRKHKNHISLGSDSHFSSSIGNFEAAIDLIKDYDRDLILNTSEEHLEKFLKSRNKSI